MKLNNNRDVYSDSFLRETVRILGLPETFSYTEDTIGTKIIIDSNKLQQLASLCDWNQKIREQFNSLNSPNHLNPQWPFEVVKNYFNIEF